MDSLEFADLSGKLNDLSVQISELAATINKKPAAPERNLLYEALAKAKLDYKTVRFNRTNSFNKQVYADLEIIQKATDAALSSQGLSFIQYPIDVDGTTFLDSILTHASGQELSCRNRLIVPGYTGAKSDNQRFGESLAYLKRQVAQCMLGVVACNDPEDNDDADASETQFNYQSRKAIAGDDSKGTVDQGIFTEKITKDQLEDLYYELQEYPVMTETLKRGLEIKELADMPKAKYASTMQHIRKQKIALMNSPKKEW
jgi:hypothetical protein